MIVRDIRIVAVADLAGVVNQEAVGQKRFCAGMHQEQGLLAAMACPR